MSKPGKRLAVAMPKATENRAVTGGAKADPNAQPLTPAQLKAMVPARVLHSHPLHSPEPAMSHDPTKIEEAVLALLFAGADRDGRAWKRYHFDAMGALFERGLVSNPRGRAESVVLTEEGLKRGAELAKRLFDTD